MTIQSDDRKPVDCGSLRTWPCVFARWLRIGNVRRSDLFTLDRRAAHVRAALRSAFASQGPSRRCQPDGGCTPAPCKPILTLQ